MRKIHAIAFLIFSFLVLAIPTNGVENDAGTCAPPVPRPELIQSLLTYYGKGPSEADIVKPDVKVISEVKMKDHTRRTISYLVEKDERVTAYLLLPESSQSNNDKLPLILCPHPTNIAGKDCVINNYSTPPKDEVEAHFRTSRQYALDLVRRGFICFAPDRAGYGQRAPLEAENDYAKQIKAYASDLKKRWPKWGFTTGKAVWDLQRALDFLVKYEPVDPQRVGIIGHSLGAWDAMLLTSVDERIAVAVANAGGTIHFDAALWTDPNSRKKLMDKPAGLTKMTNFMLMAIAPRPFLHIRAINDGYEKGQPNLLEGYRLLIEYYRRAAGNKKKNWHAPVAIYYHSNEHGFDVDARQLAYAWMERYLK